MNTEVIIPADLWEEDNEGVITSWLVSDGKQVEAGALLAEVMVDKAQFEITAPTSGIIRISRDEDDVISKGDVIAEITD